MDVIAFYRKKYYRRIPKVSYGPRYFRILPAKGATTYG